MAVPTNREQFITYCKRQLGEPVITINVDDDQVEDCVDTALSYFQDFHYDGVEQTYTQHQLTATDITNQYIPVSNGVVGITRVFSPSGAAGHSNDLLWNINYQMMVQDLWGLTSATFTHYSIVRTHMRNIELFLVGEKPIRYNRLTNRLYIDWDWSTTAKEGDYVIVEARVITDPDTYTLIWNDRMLKKLATAYIKRVWGNNMKKYGNMQLPGGIVLNGQQYYDEATAEIAEIEREIRSSYEAPPQFIVG